MKTIRVFFNRFSPPMLARRVSPAARPLAALLFLLAFCLPASAAEYDYTSSLGQVTITHYNGAGGDVLIPGTIDGLPVTAIGNAAFDNCASLISVTIPNSVTAIGDGAFRSCRSLASVTIPNSVTAIGNYPFAYCTSLASVTIPNSITAIGNYAFAYCTSLTSVAIPNSVTAIGNSAFDSCTSLTSVAIPNSVTAIGNSAFRFCTSLTSVTIPNSIIFIENYVFYSCTSLTNVSIPNSVRFINNYVFSSCTSLTSVTIPNSVRFIGNAFSFCTNLSGVYFAGNAPYLSGTPSGTATVYYLPGTTGWGSTLGTLPTQLWNPQALTSDPDFGLRSGVFGFTLTGAPGITVVVEASTTLTAPIWTPVSTNTLSAGSSYFSDADWASHPTRTYRLRSP